LKAVIYGAASSGMLYGEQLIESNKISIVGAGDDEQSKAEALTSKCKCQLFNDLDKMIDETEPELVYLFTGISRQKKLIMNALERKKYVLSNFVDVDNEEDINYMLIAVKNGQLHLLNPQKWMPYNIDLKNKVFNGSVGKPGIIHIKRYISSSYCMGCKLPDDLLGHIINEIDYLINIAGRIESVYSLKHTRSNLDYMTITLKFEGGCIANIETFNGYPGETYRTVEIAGSNGVLCSDTRKTYALQIHTYTCDEGIKTKKRSPLYDRPLLRETSSVLSRITSSEDPEPSIEETEYLLRVLIAVKKSIACTKPVYLGGIKVERK